MGVFPLILVDFFTCLLVVLSFVSKMRRAVFMQCWSTADVSLLICSFSLEVKSLAISRSSSQTFATQTLVLSTLSIILIVIMSVHLTLTRPNTLTNTSGKMGPKLTPNIFQCSVIICAVCFKIPKLKYFQVVRLKTTYGHYIKHFLTYDTFIFFRKIQ